MQNALCICGLIAFVLVYFFLPETSHPGGRGIDRELKNAEAKGIVAKRWHFLNPFKSLMLLRSPNLMAIVSLLRPACSEVLIGYTDVGGDDYAVDRLCASHAVSIHHRT